MVTQTRQEPATKGGSKMPRGEKIERPDVDPDALFGGTLNADEATKAIPGRDRKPAQLVIDQQVGEAHEAWRYKGSPERAFLKLARLDCVATQRVSPEIAEPVHAMIVKAGVLHDVSIRFGKNYTDDDGRTVISYVAMDRKS